MDGGLRTHGCGCDDPRMAQAGLMPVDRAVSLALSQVSPASGSRLLPLRAAIGRVLARDVTAAGALPAFDNSAMDGFALRLADLANRCCLPVAGTVAAGDMPRDLPAGHALRIFTGAPFPAGADSVAMIEACIDKGDKVHFHTPPEPGAHIRRTGSDQAAGTVLAARGTRLAAHHVGLFAANAIDAAPVTRPPRVAVFSTGNELLRQGPGTVADANRPMLMAQAERAGADVTDGGILPDDPQASTDALRDAAAGHDLILTSGAVSMGGKDHLRAALIAAGGSLDGWRVALKPGKPVMFGRIGHAAITGLPGNPFAAFVGFHLFAAAQIARLSGTAPRPFAAVPARAAFDWRRNPVRAEVFPVRCLGYDDAGCPRLVRLGHSVSATLLPLSGADGLAMVPAGTSQVSLGDRLTWHPFCL